MYDIYSNCKHPLQIPTTVSDETCVPKSSKHATGSFFIVITPTFIHSLNGNICRILISSSVTSIGCTGWMSCAVVISPASTEFALLHCRTISQSALTWFTCTRRISDCRSIYPRKILLISIVWRGAFFSTTRSPTRSSPMVNLSAVVALFAITSKDLVVILNRP